MIDRPNFLDVLAGIDAVNDRKLFMWFVAVVDTEFQQEKTKYGLGHNRCDASYKKMLWLGAHFL